MSNGDFINQTWQQNERTASDERNKMLCPPDEESGGEGEENENT